MPSVLYIQNTFSIWHRKSVFCTVIHKICILLVPRICILHFFWYIEFPIYIALMVKKLNRNIVCLCKEVILMVLSIMICTRFFLRKYLFHKMSFMGCVLYSTTKVCISQSIKILFCILKPKSVSQREMFCISTWRGWHLCCVIMAPHCNELCYTRTWL